MASAASPEFAYLPSYRREQTCICLAFCFNFLLLALLLNARSIGRKFEANILPIEANFRGELPLALDEDRSKDCDSVVFLHVGKNGGTTVDKFFHTYGKSFAPKRCCGHGNILGSRPLTAGNSSTCYVTLVRDPIERWLSGYLSRFRSGCPAHCNRAPEQEWIWKEFPTPNHLGEAFSSLNNSIKVRSLLAHRRIDHMHKGFAHYLPNLDAHVHEIMYVGKTCTLHDDLLPLALTVARIQGSVPLKSVYAAVKSFHSRPGLDHQHENDAKALEYLSPLARENLKVLLHKDFEILAKLKNYRLIASANISEECVKARKFSSTNLIQKEDWLDFLENNYTAYRADLMQKLSRYANGNAARRRQRL